MVSVASTCCFRMSVPHGLGELYLVKNHQMEACAVLSTGFLPTI